MLYQTPALTGWRRLGVALLILIGMAFPAAAALVAVTLRDAIAAVLVFALWEVWLVALLLDWLELRTLLPPLTREPVWWQAALKVVGWSVVGLAVGGLLLGVLETPQQRDARLQWRQGAVPQAVVIVPLAEPTLPPVLPPAPKPEPPVAVGPLQGPPLAAVDAYQKAQAAAAAAAKNKPEPPVTSPAAGGSGGDTAPKPPTNPAPPAQSENPNDSRCFGKVKVFVTPRGERLYVLPGWPDFLRNAATNWFCTEAEARAAGFSAAPH